MIKFNISLTQAAIQDIQEVSNWYFDQQPDLDIRFLNELENATNKVRLNPELYGFYSKSAFARRIKLKKFPYNVFYSFIGQNIEILAVIHTSRSDRYILKRPS